MAVRHPTVSGRLITPSDYDDDHIFTGSADMLLAADGSEVDPESLSTAGTPGTPGINGGVGSSSGLGSLFAAAPGMAVGAGITTIEMAGYASAGVGGGRYIYDAAVTSGTVAANPRTQFLAADGRGFKLDPSQRLMITMFGVVAGGSIASNGANNLAGILAAIALQPVAGINIAATVHWPNGIFYTSATINVHSLIRWRGEANGQTFNGSVNGKGTTIIAPTDVTVLINHSGDTNETGTHTGPVASAGGSIYEGISFQQFTKGTSTTAYGVWMRGTATMIDCTVRNIASHGIYIHATAAATGLIKGNANNWVVERCYAHTIGGSGLYVRGMDANAGVSNLFYTAGNTITGCGIMDNAGLNNTHLAPQITGFGDRGSFHLGRKWQLIGFDDNNTIGGATEPGTDSSVWYDLGPGSIIAGRFDQWVSGATYQLACPIYLGNTSRVYGGYQEFGTTLCHAGGLGLGLIDGPFECTSLTTQGAVKNGARVYSSGVGAYRTTNANTGDVYLAKMGTYAYTLMGTPNPLDPTERPNILEYRVQQDGEFSMYWRWLGKDTYLSAISGKQVWSISGRSTERTYGRSTVQPHYMALHDFALWNTPDSAQSRIFGLRAAVPSSGEQAVGEYYWNSNPSTGLIGWSCKATGTPGTFGKDYLNERSSPSVGIGYVALAGGAVTQATSKSTSVTLNTVCGAITMNAASLAADTSVSFTLTDSSIAATDVVNVAIKSGATAGAYVVMVDAVASGSCRISVRNLSAGALAEALVLNFAVVKAVTA